MAVDGRTMHEDQKNGDVVHALSRLDSAMQSLEAAINRRAQRQRSLGDLTSELDLMRADRMKLAALLDEALARGRALDDARRQTATRIDRAMAAIHSVVDTPGGA
jgi:chromosome segregation ATPase